jgi:hypothetical protein
VNAEMQTKECTEIRPGLAALQILPALCHVEEHWGRIELKLETPDTRYWVTTRGLTQKCRNAPINYVVNYVTVEKRTSDGRWDLNAVFSPAAWKLSQAFDYCQVLYRDLRELNERLERSFSWETKQRLDEVLRELELTNRVIRDLSEQVAASNAEKGIVPVEQE